MSVGSGQPIAARSLNVNDYSYTEVCLNVNQIADPPHPLPDINSAHCSSLTEPLSVLHLYYKRRIMPVTFRLNLNPKRTTLSEAIEDSAGRRILKQDLKMDAVDEIHRCQATMTLLNVDGLQWTRHSTCNWR